MQSISTFYKVFHGLLLCCLLFSFPAFTQSDASGDGIFYRVTHKDNKDTSYLFGSYHLIRSSYLDKKDEVMRAFGKAEGVVVEVLIDTGSTRAIQEMGILKEGTLKDLLDQPFLDTLIAELKNDFGLGIMQVNHLKPSNLMINLSMMLTMKNNSATLQGYTGLPIDMYFASAAKKEGKRVVALETVAEQMDILFNRPPINEQIAGLKLFIRNKKEMTELGDRLLSSWIKGDMDAILQIYNRSQLYAVGEDLLVKPRNLKWMNTLPGLMKEGAYFIAVGALHLPGPDGLISLFQKEGYTIESVKQSTRE